MPSGIESEVIINGICKIPEFNRRFYMKIKKITSMILALALMGAMAGCGGSSKSAETSSASKAETAASSEAAEKDSSAPSHITAALSYMEPGLDPANGYYGWVTVRMGVTECLVKLDDEVKVENWLAESVTNVDETTWEVVLKDGVTFSNGTPVDAEAVKACYERTLSMSSMAQDYLKVDKIEADGMKLTFTTTEPNAAFKNNLCDPVFSVYDASQSDDDINNGVIGTGPFVVDQFVPEASAELVKNENYWDGEVGLDTVSIVYISDAEARQNALQSGELDITTNIDKVTSSLFSDTEKYSVYENNSLRVYTARINCKEVSPMSDVELRRGIGYAIDRDSYANLIGGTAAHSFYSDAAPFGNDKIDAMNYDVDKANKILDDAGYVDKDGDGFRDRKDGSELNLTFLIKGSFGSNDASTLASAIQSDLKNVGINVTIGSMESTGHGEPDTYWDMYTVQNNTAITGDPQAYLSATYGSENAIGYQSKEIDEFIEELNSTFDTDERYEIAAEVSQHMNDNAADLYLTNGYYITVTSARLKNAFQPVCDYYFLTADMYVEE